VRPPRGVGWRGRRGLAERLPGRCLNRGCVAAQPQAPQGYQAPASLARAWRSRR